MDDAPINESAAVSWTDSLLVKPAARHGLGVFARRHFETDEIIERVPCVEIPDEEMHFARMRGTIMHRYPMPGVPDPEHSVWMLGYGSLYNHEPDPQLSNARWEWIGNRTLVFIATRPIAAGEEITYDYGTDTGFSGPEQSGPER
jgi:SET domain-containing protein